MVSAHESWEDIEDGYKNGNHGVFVEPAFIESGGGVRTARVGVADTDANAYTVSFHSGLESGSGTQKSIVDFEDPRTAWEYANLTTHFLEDAPDPEVAVPRLQGISDPTEDNWTPDGIVTDLDAETVMRKLLGHSEFRLDDALSNSDE